VKIGISQANGGNRVSACSIGTSGGFAMDVNTNAFRIVNALTSEKKEDERKRSEIASAAGVRGGRARARMLPRERRIEIARKANNARWARGG
jgi:hypothetical protein